MISKLLGDSCSISDGKAHWRSICNLEAACGPLELEPEGDLRFDSTLRELSATPAQLLQDCHSSLHNRNNGEYSIE